MSSVNVGAVSFWIPSRRGSSQLALEARKSWAPISNGPSSSRAPAGTQVYPVSRKGFGTVDPQRLQNQERNPVERCHLPIDASSDRQRNLSAATMSPVFETEPPCLRHSEQ